jgi:hypothetical protein
VARAFLPQRWLACVSALVLSAVALWLVGLVFPGAPELSPLGWLEQPRQQGSKVLAWVEQGGRLAVVVAGVLVISFLGATWASTGGFIARDELVRWRQATLDRPQPSPLAFVLRWRARLWALVLVASVLVGTMLLVPVSVRMVLWLPGSSVVIALLLPVLWLAVLVQTLIVLGAISFVLQPAALAAEGADSFDAFSRSYSYFYQWPLLFAVLETVTVLLAGAPLAGLIRWLELNPQALAGAVRPWVVLAVLGLSLSLFWSLQPLVYAVLRLRVDEVPGDTVFDEAEGTAEAAPAAPAESNQARPPQPAAGSPLGALRGALLGVALFALSWLGMGRLMTWLAGERAAWLRWELYPLERPAVAGVELAAAWIAGFWLAAGLALGALLPLLLRALRQRRHPGEGGDPG